jgi:hypothetical protein
MTSVNFEAYVVKSDEIYKKSKAVALANIDDGLIEGAAAVYAAAYVAAKAKVQAAAYAYAEKYAAAVVAYNGDADAPAKTNAIHKAAYNEAINLAAKSKKAVNFPAVEAAKAVNKALIITA